jgi:hypothetical protein
MKSDLHELRAYSFSLTEYHKGNIEMATSDVEIRIACLNIAFAARLDPEKALEFAEILYRWVMRQNAAT